MTNVFLVLTTAMANSRKVDVLIVNNQITEATDTRISLWVPGDLHQHLRACLETWSVFP